MTMKIWPVIASIAFVTSVHAQTPYAGMQTRPIKALSEQQIARRFPSSRLPTSAPAAAWAWRSRPN
jgi:hypothetical protein